jgi:hypothetical protein
MSNVWARMLIAGTVNPETSPRGARRYSSWMLALWAPSSRARLVDQPLAEKT